MIAGAKHIVVEIKKGGKELIKVTDDGKGIKPEDVLISLERHATSKIKKVEDLEKTYTMGFRGEALASIVSVSKFTMITRTIENETAVKVVAERWRCFRKYRSSRKCSELLLLCKTYFSILLLDTNF